MRKLKVCERHGDFDVTLEVIPEVESEKTLLILEERIGRKFTSDVVLAILEGIQNLVNEPEKFRMKPKLHIDLEHGLAWPIGWPVYVKTETVSDLFIPVGLSIGLTSVDNKVVAIQRSLKNKSCKGFLGTPAGFMTIAYQDFVSRKLPATINLREEIQKNVEDQLLHELGLIPDEYKWKITYLIRVDYPSNQQEFLVSARSSLTAEEIVARASKNKGTDTGLSENRVIPIDSHVLTEMMNRGVPMATQHVAALCNVAGLAYELIYGMSRPDPNIPYEKEIIVSM